MSLMLLPMVTGIILRIAITLRMLHDDNRIALYYDAHSNPNGSVDNIAGVFSADFKVLGMMPHPENAIDKTRRDGTAMGHDDGLCVISSNIRVINICSHGCNTTSFALL